MGKKNNNKSSTDSNTKSSGVYTEVVPDEFKTVIYDFINDFTTTFPEYSECLEEYFSTVSVVSDDGNGVKTERLIADDSIIKLYTYCKEVYPVRFFDILYKNGEIFNSAKSAGGGGDEPSLKMDVNFLPNIDFMKVWNTPDISDNTRNTIWKYLQLILFSIITNISDRDSFGDTAKLFEAINEEELKTKLEETFKNMQDMFAGDTGNTGDTSESGKTGENAKFDGVNMGEFEKFAEQFKNLTGENGEIDMSAFPGLSGFPGFPGFDFKNAASSGSAGAGAGADAGDGGEGNASSGDTKKKPEMPNPETIHEHISKLLNGKIGSLAKEIAEETAGDLDLGIDMDDPSKIDMGSVFQKLFKNPGKLMNMVKNVGKKLDDKFKNGDIKESEIMQEASDLLSNMKNMPGMGNLTSMLNQLGMSGLGGLGGLSGLGGKGGKVNMGALQSHFQQNMKQAKMKERMLNKLQQKQQAKPAAHPTQPLQSSQTSQVRPTTSVFNIGEQIQQTPRPTTVGQNGAAVGTGLQSPAGDENKILVNENTNAQVSQKKKKKKNKK
jgi:hypothetical protein